MYMIIGLQDDGRQCLVAAPFAAAEALVQYHTAQKIYPRVRIQSCGETLTELELISRSAVTTTIRSA